MYKLINRLLANDKIRYLIAGGCTTFVNLITFFILRNYTSVARNTCNAIAIACAIAFAYFANKLFVFRSKTKGLSRILGEAFTFVVARIVSMIVEIIGFAILCDSFRINEVASKLLVQILVLVLNYIFSATFVFNRERKNFKEFVTDNYSYIITFATIFVLILVVCIVEGVKPFGKNTIFLVDSTHQYVPFLAEYRDKLLHEGSLFYTWNLALGSNFMSLTAYYVSSPFNYALLLFSKENLIVIMTLLAIIKIALSGVAMVHFLAYFDGEKKQNMGMVAIGLSYALSNYFLGYYWNIMWLDCLMIFPLIMLGAKRLFENNDPKLYTLSLFYCLYCNYYIGFMVCVFLILAFFVVNHGGIKKFFTDGFKFAGCSLLAAGMSAFLLIPAYMGITSTSSAETKLPKWEWYVKPVEYFKQLMFKTKPMTMQVFDGGVNLYCGVFVIFAVIAFAFTKKIKLIEKIKVYLLLAFIFVSFNSTTLNYIWHGFHDQHGIPNRFSFAFIFVLLIMAYRVYQDLEDMKEIFLYLSILGSIGFIIYLILAVDSIPDVGVYVVTSVLIVVYFGVILAGRKEVYPKKFMKTVLAAMISIEIIFNAAFGFANNGYLNYDRKYKTAPDVTKAYDRASELAGEDAGLFRAEMMKTTTLNESTYHNMPSVGTFCSTVRGDVVDTMGKLGFYTGVNEFLYQGYTPFTNSIFNIKYVFGREGDLNNFDFNYVETVGDIEIYENPYPLSIAFGVSDRVKNYDEIFDGHAIDNLNNLSYAMTGGTKWLDRIYPEYYVESSSCEVAAKGGNISYKPYGSGAMSFEVSTSIEADGDYYIHCRGNGITELRILINGNEYAFDRYQWQVFHLGALKNGDTVTVEYKYNSVSNPGNAYISLSRYDKMAYEDVYSELSKNLMQVEEYEDGYLRGTINIEEGCTMFSSIPYDEGWKVEVDGKKADYYKVCGAFIGVDMEPGEHEVVMTYMPQGLKAGMMISIPSWLVMMVLLFIDKKKNRRTDGNTENAP